MRVVCVVEWAQYIEDELPQAFLKLQIDRVGDGESERVIRLVPHGKEYEEFIKPIGGQLMSKEEKLHLRFQSKMMPKRY